jgi:hypothetical protein
MGIASPICQAGAKTVAFGGRFAGGVRGCDLVRILSVASLEAEFRAGRGEGGAVLGKQGIVGEEYSGSPPL